MNNIITPAYISDDQDPLDKVVADEQLTKMLYDLNNILSVSEFIIFIETMEDQKITYKDIKKKYPIELEGIDTSDMKYIYIDACEKIKKHYFDNESRGNDKSNKCKRIIKIDKRTGMHIKTYGSTMQASKENGICRKAISACATGKQKTSGGYIWKFEEDYKNEKN